MWTSTFLLMGVVMTSLILPNVYSLELSELLSCDFENDLCHYRPWGDRMTTQKAGTAGMGPTKDHANSENGHYAIGKGYRTYHGFRQFKSLQQSWINVTTDSCLTFWYFLSDTKHSNFKVFLYNHPMPPAIEVMTEISKPDKMWTKAYVDLETRFYSYIELTGVITGESNQVIRQHYIAFDDILFEETPCQRLRQADANAP